MEAYTVGKCPQCGVQIQVQGTDGRWTTRKPNCRQADILFQGGQRVRVCLCKDCLESPNRAAIVSAIVHPASNASSRATLDMIQTYGPAISIRER
jgi:hypothetical protein